MSSFIWRFYFLGTTSGIIIAICTNSLKFSSYWVGVWRPAGVSKKRLQRVLCSSIVPNTSIYISMLTEMVIFVIMFTTACPAVEVVCQVVWWIHCSSTSRKREPRTNRGFSNIHDMCMVVGYASGNYQHQFVSILLHLIRSWRGCPIAFVGKKVFLKLVRFWPHDHVAPSNEAAGCV